MQCQGKRSVLSFRASALLHILAQLPHLAVLELCNTIQPFHPRRQLRLARKWTSTPSDASRLLYSVVPSSSSCSILRSRLAKADPSSSLRNGVSNTPQSDLVAAQAVQVFRSAGERLSCLGAEHGTENWHMPSRNGRWRCGYESQMVSSWFPMM
jgi:hypothetical protein